MDEILVQSVCMFHTSIGLFCEHQVCQKRRTVQTQGRGLPTRTGIDVRKISKFVGSQGMRITGPPPPLQCYAAGIGRWPDIQSIRSDRDCASSATRSKHRAHGPKGISYLPICESEAACSQTNAAVYVRPEGSSLQLGSIDYECSVCQCGGAHLLVRVVVWAGRHLWCMGKGVMICSDIEGDCQTCKTFC